MHILICKCTSRWDNSQIDRLCTRVQSNYTSIIVIIIIIIIIINAFVWRQCSSCSCLKINSPSTPQAPGSKLPGKKFTQILNLLFIYENNKTFCINVKANYTSIIVFIIIIYAENVAACCCSWRSTPHVRRKLLGASSLEKSFTQMRNSIEIWIRY